MKASGIPVVETWDLPNEPVDMLIGFSHQTAGELVADVSCNLGRAHPALVSGTDPRAYQRPECLRAAPGRPRKARPYRTVVGRHHGGARESGRRARDVSNGMDAPTCS